MTDKSLRDALHVSVRLPWHDRGWDGRICDNPKYNAYCGGLRSVNAERIRSYKSVSKDGKCQSLYESGQVVDTPPCTETINVFGGRPVQHTHLPPSFLSVKGTKPRDERLPPFSSGTWPFEDMWREDGKPFPPDKRKADAKAFFEKLKDGKSLIFYYCNYDNPITADIQQYLLVGIARLKKKRPDFVYWPEIPETSAKRYGDFVWSWILENGYPEEGVRIPYQEYLAKGKSPEELSKVAVVIEEDLARRFKYVSRHLTNDDALILIEETIRSLKQVSRDGIVLKGCDWNEKIEWLDLILRECWKKRGLYPGLAPTLAYCGFQAPGTYIREILLNIGDERIRDYIFDRLEKRPKKRVKMTKKEDALYGSARERFNSMSLIVRKLCRERLPLFDLTDEQIGNILGEQRKEFGITSSLETIHDNPYCICEEYVGSDVEDRIGFHRIDNGMISFSELGSRAEGISLDDPRRLRAIMVKQLESSARQGHTFLDRQDLYTMIHNKHQKSGRKGRFLLDEATWPQHRPFFTSKMILDSVSGLHAVFLERLHRAERNIRKRVLELMREELLAPSKRHWRKIIEDGFKGERTKERPIEAAMDQQIKALEVMYRARFSILTGGAGVGKTTVLRTFVEGIRQIENNHEFLLLAPTGKASVIMRRKIGLEARTIHSLLNEYKWINPQNWTLLQEGGRKIGGIQTVIIDEASMLDVEVMATLFRALNWNQVERLVLVGDANQLPPIGPGKPFVDILDYIRKDQDRMRKHLAELIFNCRQSQGSQTVKLAAHYSKSSEQPCEEVLWLLDEKRSKEDLVIRFWENEEELLKLIEATLLEAAMDVAEAKGIESKEQHIGVTEIFDLVHSLNDLGSSKDLEAVQFITPYRYDVSGVGSVNLLVQRLLRGDITVRRYSTHGFVWKDKVVQVRNFNYWAWDHEQEKTARNEDTYVPNGAIGYVFPRRASDGKIQVKFPRDFVRYSYYLTGKQIETNLELGYALSVHKSQGSQFTNTIFILPAKESDFLSRELLYTALTRNQNKLYLLLEKNSSLLKDRLWTGHSEILRRNSALFKTAKGIPKEQLQRYRPQELLCEALPGFLVRSEGEVEISKALTYAGIPFHYEKILPSKDGQTFRLPDFTFQYRRKTYYWEHLGRLDDPIYAEDWKRKNRWYTANGYDGQLLVTPIEGMTLRQSIQCILRDRLGAVDDVS